MLNQKKFYLTKKGLEGLKKEHKELKSLLLSKNEAGLPQFWHSEDLNPEYLSYLEDINFLESRIAELDNIIKNAELIIVPSKEKQGIVGLGAKVLVEIDGRLDDFEIVGTPEANPAIGKISNESPIGKAFLNHKVGDEIVISSLIKSTYKIKKITYQSA